MQSRSNVVASRAKVSSWPYGVRPIRGKTISVGRHNGTGKEKPVVRNISVASFWMATTPVTEAQYRAYLEELQGFRWKVTCSGQPNSGVEPVLLAKRSESRDDLYARAKKKWEGLRFSRMTIEREILGAIPAFLAKGRGDHFPLVGISWKEARAFCRYYEVSGMAGDLPTVLQFERAAQGPSGKDLNLRKAVLHDNGYRAIQPVLGRDRVHNREVKERANGFGLIDILGNTWEFTRNRYLFDLYQRLGRETLAVENLLPDEENRTVELRGGSYTMSTAAVTPSTRHAFPWDQGHACYTFRPVWSVLTH